MTGTTCIVCKVTKKKVIKNMFCIPQCSTCRKELLQSLNLEECDINKHGDARARKEQEHDGDGDFNGDQPSLALGPKLFIEEDCYFS